MSKYTVKQTCYFSAAHILRGYPEACERLHGHNYKVIIEVSAKKLDKLGMVYDYLDIEKAAKDPIAELDHRFLNDIPPFDTINPTTENIAYLLFKKIANNITDDRVSLESITIWETEHNCVSYSESLN